MDTSSIKVRINDPKPEAVGNRHSGPHYTSYAVGPLLVGLFSAATAGFIMTDAFQTIRYSGVSTILPQTLAPETHIFAQVTPEPLRVLPDASEPMLDIELDVSVASEECDFSDDEMVAVASAMLAPPHPSPKLVALFRRRTARG